MACDRFHWTLDYVEGLDPVELDAVMSIVDAVDRGRAHLQDKQSRKSRKK